MNFQSPLFSTALDTAGTTGVLLDRIPPSVLDQTPMIDQLSHSWQAPVVALASSIIIQLALKGAKILISFFTKKISPQTPTISN